jgi:hypothetical protein
LANHKDISNEIANIFSLTCCSIEQSYTIRNEMIRLGIIKKIKGMIEDYLNEYIFDISSLDFSSKTSNYLKSLANIRFKNNLQILAKIE